MYSNEQLAMLVIQYTKEMENYINIIEAECKAAEPNLRAIANASGKLSKIYGLVTEFVGTFSGKDWRIGGFRESVWATQNNKSKGEQPTDGD